MTGIMDREPALAIQLVSAVIVCAIAFGIRVTTQQQLAIEQLVGIVVAIMGVTGIVTRSRVWCPKSVVEVQDKAYRTGLVDGAM